LRVVLGEEDYLEIYADLFQRQQGVCAICQKPPKQTRFHMDHDHHTLEIRGLLCYSCNTKLGWFEKFRRVIGEYLDYS
jgi:hypothetical protein